MTTPGPDSTGAVSETGRAIRAGLKTLPAVARSASRPSSLLAALLAGILVANWIISSPQHITASVAAGAAVTLVPFLMIPWRSRIPELLLAASAACVVLAALLGVSGGADIAAIVAVYTIAAERTIRAAAVAIVVAVAASALAGLAYQGTANILSQLAAWAVIGALACSVAVLGRAMARRRALVRTLVDRTEDLERERSRLESERELLAREAVAVERARIARELHDVVAHHVSVMVIQAGAAQATLPPGSDSAAQSLEAIRQTGREAMIEMRRLLGLLRAELPTSPDTRESPAGGGAAATPDIPAPQPGIADLPALADRMRDAGLQVDLEVRSGSRLPAGIDLSAYRIVQEALTNTLRHAGVGARAHVCVDHEPGAAGNPRRPDQLVIEIVDDGSGRRPAAVERGPAGIGHGLVGMRERVSLFGGSVLAAPRAEGGFRVVARFPLEDGDDGDGGGDRFATPGRSEVATP